MQFCSTFDTQWKPKEWEAFFPHPTRSHVIKPTIEWDQKCNCKQESPLFTNLWDDSPHSDDLLGTLRSNGAKAKQRHLKSKFAFFQSLPWLFLSTYFVKCRWTLPKLNSRGPYPSSERRVKFHHCFFTSSIKCEIKHFHVLVMQKRLRNVQKSVLHM